MKNLKILLTTGLMVLSFNFVDSQVIVKEKEVEVPEKPEKAEEFERQRDAERKKRQIDVEIRELEAQKREEMRQKEMEMKLKYEQMRQNAMDFSKDSQYEYQFFYSNPGQSSQLSLSKAFDGESVESSKNFEVQEGIKHISLSLSGNVKEGVIEIEMIKPNGKKYMEFKIDNTSDVQWRQTIVISEEEKELRGTWKINIKTSKAKGVYNFRFSAS